MLEYAHRVGDNHRKSFGQFFTHPDVAEFMAHWVLASGKKSLFNPAFGLGAFYKAISKDSNVAFSAREVDPEIIKFWEQETDADSGFITTEDYLRSWSRNHSNNGLRTCSRH